MKRKKPSISRLKKKAQVVFNAYIRERDKNLVCISCGKPEKLQAGHFFSVRRFDNLRYDEDNVHGECARCNLFDDSHLIFYYDNLKHRIGIERTESLKARAQIKHKWTIEELEQIIEVYGNKTREFKHRI
jgi:hypothetical protein